ncbi:MAG: hypothetical protein HKN79_03340 [Flavobacteriales bacterium]|nr:hypothetical protein [Flavobacteriales bacterium]
MTKEFTGILDELDSNVWNRFVDVPTDIVLFYKKKDIKRFLCTYDNMLTKSCALLSRGDGRYFVMLNKQECKKLGVHKGAELRIKLEPDTSKYGMPMPEEMEELLAQDPEADRYFQQLSPGKQRSLLYIVGKPKGTETRLRKAITICEYLKSVEGALDFRELNQAFKDNRFKLQ